VEDLTSVFSLFRRVQSEFSASVDFDSIDLDADGMAYIGFVGNAASDGDMSRVAIDRFSMTHAKSDIQHCFLDLSLSSLRAGASGFLVLDARDSCEKVRFTSSMLSVCRFARGFPVNK
jgi:hypothetical protein